MAVDRFQVRHRRSVAEQRQKDGWDKAAVISQIVSSILIGSISAAVAIFGTRISNTVQNAQLESTERKQTGDYVKEIATATDAERRAQLIETLDLAVRSDDAYRIALHYAAENRSGAAPSDPRLIYDQSLDVLGRLEPRYPGISQKFADHGTHPASDIAAAIAGREIRLWVRATGVDDSAVLAINGVPAAEFPFGNSEWVDVTDKLKPNKNHFQFVVTNIAAQTGAHLEMSAGTQQYDTRTACPVGPDNAQAILFSGSIVNEATTDASVRSLKLFTEGPNFYIPGGYATTCPWGSK